MTRLLILFSLIFSFTIVNAEDINKFTPPKKPIVEISNPRTDIDWFKTWYKYKKSIDSLISSLSKNREKLIDLQKKVSDKRNNFFWKTDNTSKLIVSLIDYINYQIDTLLYKDNPLVDYDIDDYSYGLWKINDDWYAVWYTKNYSSSSNDLISEWFYLNGYRHWKFIDYFNTYEIESIYEYWYPKEYKYYDYSYEFWEDLPHKFLKDHIIFLDNWKVLRYNYYSENGFDIVYFVNVYNSRNDYDDNTAVATIYKPNYSYINWETKLLNVLEDSTYSFENGEVSSNTIKYKYNFITNKKLVSSVWFYDYYKNQYEWEVETYFYDKDDNLIETIIDTYENWKIISTKTKK